MLLSPADVVSMYHAGATIADIIRNGAHNYRWIYWCLSEAGVHEVRSKFLNRHLLPEDDPNTPLIRRWRRQGATIEEIAATLKRTPRYVRRRLEGEPALLQRLKPRKRRPPKITVPAHESQKIRDLHAGGMALEEIAKVMDRSEGTVRAHIRCEPIQAKKTAATVPWPRVTSNFTKAMKGRRFEDVALRSLGAPAAIQNAARFL